MKTMETNGHISMQVGISEKKPQRTKSIELGHFLKAKVEPMRKLVEFKVSHDMLMSPGTQINAAHFVAGQFVDVAGMYSLFLLSFICLTRQKVPVREKVLRVL